MKQREVGVAQTLIEIITGASKSSISRYIKEKSIKHLNLEKTRNKKYALVDARKIIKEFSKIASIQVKHRIHAFHNFKGGTGKTSICYQVAFHTSLLGFKVLAIDVDPQAHLSTALGLSGDNDYPTLYDTHIGTHNIRDITVNIAEGLDCIPSNYALTRIESELKDATRREERFKLDYMDLFEEYDFVFVDTNPSISLLNRNVLTMSDIIHIVTEPQPLSIRSVKLLLDDMGKFTRSMAIPSKVINIIPNKYEDRSSTAMEGDGRTN